jgi:hypothetical protein
MSQSIYNPLNLNNPVPVDFDDMSDHEPCVSNSGYINAFYGKKHTPKTLQQCASFGFKGKKHSPEAIKKMKKVDKSYMQTSEYKKKMSETNVGFKGKKHSPETIKKMSEAKKGNKNPNFNHSIPRL